MDSINSARNGPANDHLIISIRTSLRKAVTSALVVARSEDVLSRLLDASSDKTLKKEIRPAIYDNDIEFIQVLLPKVTWPCSTKCWK